jgi:hypothetical protein
MATEPPFTLDGPALAEAIRPIVKRATDGIQAAVMRGVTEQVSTQAGTAVAAQIKEAEDEAKRFSIAYAEQARKVENALSNGTILAASIAVTDRAATPWADLSDDDKGVVLADVTAALGPVADALGVPRPAVPTLAEVTFEEPTP